MDTISKVCRACHCTKPLYEFYNRSYTEGVASECIECMKKRSKGKRLTNEDYLKSLVASEELAISYLHRNGIPALPGKAMRHSFVDVIAFGCVRLEVKCALLEDERGVKKFSFKTTPAQQKNGFRADVVMLICDYGDHSTYHLFPAKHEVFYMGDRLKTGFTFTPGNYEAKKHGGNRTVLVQGMMNETEDKVSLIHDKLQEIMSELRSA